MANSKKKGNRGELRICKILTERFGVKFNRVPNSGAFGTTHILQLDAQRVLSGDLICPASWVFSLEVKSGYDLDFTYFFSDKITPDKKMFQGFCEQSCEDATRIEGRIPMVLYTKDRRDTVVAIPRRKHSRAAILEKRIKAGELSLLIVDFEMEKFPKWTEWVIMSLSDLMIFNNSFFFDGEIEPEKNGK